MDLGGNRGFAAAANAAIAAFPATGAVLILSPRVRLTPGCVKVMLDALHGPGAGIAVPRLFREPGQPYPSLRRRPTPVAGLRGGAPRRQADPAFRRVERADRRPGALRQRHPGGLGHRGGDHDEPRVRDPRRAMG